jgi:hypothetical protein
VYDPKNCLNIRLLSGVKADGIKGSQERRKEGERQNGVSKEDYEVVRGNRRRERIIDDAIPREQNREGKQDWGCRRSYWKCQLNTNE